MKVLIIDNYDSFTFNLYQLIGDLLENQGSSFQLEVHRNDQISMADIAKKHYNRIVISPGPGDPNDRSYFGVCGDVIAELHKDVPILGVCLGMQGMAVSFGGNIKRAQAPKHGKTSIIHHDEKGVFENLPNELSVMRYHSLVVESESLPPVFAKTAMSTDTGELMGIRHIDYPWLEGIQFHPESFATEGGVDMLRNFLFSKHG